ncbi:MAG: hypothetical protein AB7P03_20955 [Kofleriaceae bacterium]
MRDALRLQAHTARAQLIARTLRDGALNALLWSIDPSERDEFVDELLGIGPPPPDRDLPRGAVPYLPCSADAVLEMVEAVPVAAHDELVDIGSGLGRAVMLGHLLSGARARGIELQHHLVEHARARCDALGLTEIELVHANAAELELDGSVFLLYAPCNGALLEAVLRRIESVARRRTIVVCTIDLELEHVRWLVRRATASTEISIYDARP